MPLQKNVIQAFIAASYGHRMYEDICDPGIKDAARYFGLPEDKQRQAQTKQYASFQVIPRRGKRHNGAQMLLLASPWLADAIQTAELFEAKDYAASTVPSYDQNLPQGQFGGVIGTA